MVQLDNFTDNSKITGVARVYIKLILYLVTLEGTERS